MAALHAQAFNEAQHARAWVASLEASASACAA
jgi:hypothetical protein